MKIIKNILIGLGLITVFFIAAIAFLAGESSEFKKANENFVSKFTRDYSSAWDITSVSEFTTNDFLSQINSSKGKQATRFFQSLGKVVEISDMELSNYNSHTDGITTGTFKFKATFEHAKTLVTVTVQEVNNITKIQGLYIDALNEVSSSKEFKT